MHLNNTWLKEEISRENYINIQTKLRVSCSTDQDSQATWTELKLKAQPIKMCRMQWKQCLEEILQYECIY